jgi:hypothetical protein|tara:strand:+ start:818 stop:919 length:102 start_codon:yes stop_codon:yes gene_type:complete
VAVVVLATMLVLVVLVDFSPEWPLLLLRIIQFP